MRLFFVGLVLLLVVYPGRVLAQGCGGHNAECCSGALCSERFTCTKDNVCEDLQFNCVQVTPYDIRTNCQLLPSGWLDPPRSDCWRHGANCWDNFEKCQKDCTACSVAGGKCCIDLVGSAFCHNGLICSITSMVCIDKNPKPTSPPRPTEPVYTPVPTRPIPTSTPIPIPTEKPEKIIGDYNGDGSVNVGDYSVWRTEYVDKIAWNKDGTFASANASNGVVDTNGYSTWRYAFLR